jgi:hypothetical protein
MRLFVVVVILCNVFGKELDPMHLEIVVVTL